MKGSYKFILVCVLISAFAIVLTGSSCKKKTLTQEMAVKKIQSLPEVQGYTTQLREKDTRPFIKVESSNDKSSSLEFSVGESHPTHTILWNRFSIDKTNGDIFIFNIESGDYIPIEEWRKKK